MVKHRAIDKNTKIENKNHRKVTLCKRRRGFIKKAIELSRLCDQKIFFILFDPETDKLVQFSSDPDFNFKKVYETTKRIRNGPEADLKFEKYTNLDYRTF